MSTVSEFSGAGKAAGMTVWRIEAFKPVPVAESFHGQFYSGDSYLILSSKKTANGLAHDIYIWLGNETSLDEAGTAAILAVQLDESMGGLPVQHREEQGSESAEFLSLFKSCGGVVYLAGGAASGFHHVEAVEYAPSLLQIKGKRNVVARQVALSASSLNEGDCFLLDLGFNLYLWCGSASNTLEKSKAVEVMSRIHSSRGAKTHRVVYADASEEEKAAFWAALGGSAADVQAPIPDEDKAGAPAAEAKLYRVTNAAAGAVTAEEISKVDGKLSKALLPAGHVALLDVGSEVFVWTSKSAPASERADGLRIAGEFIKKSTGRVTVVREGGETPLFKAAFFQWDPVSTFDFSKVVSKGVAGTEGRSVGAEAVDYAALVSGSGASAPTLPTGGSVKQWQVQGTGVEQTEPEAVGNFLAGDSYVVKYDYTDASGSAGTTVLFWLGRHSDNIEQGTAALTARDLADEASKVDSKSHVAQVRVVHGSEPTFFTRLFDGLMVVHAGGAKGSLHAKDAHLYHIKGSSTADTKAIEVEPSASSLNSGDSFVLIVPGAATAYMWAGKGANSAEKEAAGKLGSKLVALWTHKSSGLTALPVTEGSEPEEFWAALGGKAEYPEALSPPAMQLSRLFEVSDASGSLRVDEIHSWGQGDLIQDDVMIVDAGNTVYVWVGAGASLKEKAEASAIADKYVAAGAAAGTHDANVPIFRVQSGSEPALFTALFPGWDYTSAEVLSDPYESKLAELKAQKEAQKESVAAAAAEREVKRAAAVAAAEASRVATGAEDGHESATLSAAAGGLKHVAAKAPASPAVDAHKAAAIEAAAAHLKHSEAWAKSGPAASPTAQAAVPVVTGALSGIKVTYEGASHAIELLKAVTPTTAGPFAGINFSEKQLLVAESDFPAVFGVDKKTFEALPKWKQGDAKKKAGLY